MSHIYKGTLDLIGRTPLVEVTNLERTLDLAATLLVKLEYLNPAGSVKDRAAKAMIEENEGFCGRVLLLLSLPPAILESGLPLLPPRKAILLF